MADINGKIGAAQYVHMMNVMCGFEESLGIL
jgi:N-acetyl-gamma-glutamylphosphate reductase